MSTLFLLGLILFEIIADIMTKEYSLSNSYRQAVLALVFYVLANSSWLISMRYKSELAIGANVFAVSTGIIATLLGVGFYDEHLHVQQYLGIALGIVAVVLLVA